MADACEIRVFTVKNKEQLQVQIDHQKLFDDSNIPHQYELPELNETETDPDRV